MGTDKNQHNKDTGSNIERSDERIAETQEVFTPMEMCEEMVQMILDIEKENESRIKVS